MKLESKRAELNREKTTRSVLAQFPFGRVEFKRCLKLAEAIFVFWINKALESVAACRLVQCAAKDLSQSDHRLGGKLFGANQLVCKMKRALAIGVFLAVVIFFTLLLKLPDLKAPRFNLLQTPPSLPPSFQISYDFLGARPFESGGMWIYASGPTNSNAFLFDINKKMVVGKLTNGWPAMRIGPTKLLCIQAMPNWRPLKERLLAFIERITRNKISFRRPQRIYGSGRYWLLDLESNSAVRLGDLPGFPNFTIQSSPDLHYGYTLLHSAGAKFGTYCFDFKKRSIRELDVPGVPSGWWDRTKILIVTTNHDFVLYDVTTAKTSPLIGSERIAAFLHENMISDDAAQAGPFFIWNGLQNDFYLTDTHKKWAAAESFLIKVERPDGTLKLLASRFKFEWSDHFDPTGRYYLYSGREAGAASDGVFIRDMQSGTNRTLVMPTANNYFSIPRFYEDSVIYIRSNMLWRISLDGTKNVQLFPP